MPKAKRKQHFGTLVGELDRITSIIAASLHLRLIPGDEWQWDTITRRLMYPRDQLLKIDPHAVTGALWRTIQHALSSTGEFDAYSVAVDAVLAAETAAGGIRSLHPAWVLGLMLNAEHERVEHIARAGARNLGNSYLPVRGQGYRTKELADDLAAIALNDPQDTHVPNRYWERAARAFGMMASGAITRDDLPADMAWDETLCDEIRTLPNEASYDSLQSAVEHLVTPLARAWIDFLVKPEEPHQQKEESAKKSGTPKTGESEGASSEASGTADSAEGKSTKADPAESPTDPIGADDGEPASAPSKKASNTTGDDDDAPGDNNEPAHDDKAEDDTTLAHLLEHLSDGDREAIAKAIDELGTDELAIDFFDDTVTSPEQVEAHNVSDDPTAATPTPAWGNSYNDPLLRADDGPAWNAVSRSAAGLTQRVRRSILQHLVENEVADIEHGTTSGRLHHRALARPAHASSQRPFKRRQSFDDRSYAFAIVLDRSGSMCASTDGEGHPEAFGTTSLRRWHTAARMGVALTEALHRLDSTSLDLAIFTYDDNIDKIKGIHDGLSESVKQAFMNNVRARGDNDDAGVLHAALRELSQSHAENKVIIHLTDGQFCSSAHEMNSVVRDLARANIELIILTLDIGPDFARRFVPRHLADAVGDDTLAPVLARHLRRVLAA